MLAFTGSPGAEGDAVGLALYFFNFSTWTGRPGLYVSPRNTVETSTKLTNAKKKKKTCQLEDLFVSETSRGAGVGKALFGELAAVAQENNCARMDWAVLKWNKPSIDFYEKALGAIPMSEWQGMRLEEDGIERLKRFRITE